MLAALLERSTLEFVRQYKWERDRPGQCGRKKAVEYCLLGQCKCSTRKAVLAVEKGTGDSLVFGALAVHQLVDVEDIVNQLIFLVGHLTAAGAFVGRDTLVNWD